MATYEPGKWFDITSNRSFEDFRKWCKRNNKPFFALETNEKHSGDKWDCSWCKHFYKSCLGKSKFTDWMSTSRMYYCKGLIGKFDDQMIEDVGTSYGGYPYGYVYKNSNEYDYFCRPVSDDNGTANNPTGREKVYINTPDRLINFLKKYEFSEPVTVTFKDWDGRTLKTQQLEKGQDATPPDPPPSRPRYEFTGWSGNYKNIQKDETVTAQYKEVQPDTDQGKLIIDSQCFGAKRDVTFQCSDGKLVYYLYPENYIVDSLENKITFDANNATNGNQADMPVSVRKTWVCPSPTISRTNYIFASWNSKKDGTGTTYVPGTSYPAPNKALTLYAQWTAAGKLYAVLAGYSSDSGHNSLNSVSANEIEKLIKNYSSSNITKLNGSEAKPTSIVNAIKDALAKDDCGMLFIYLCGHGGRTTVGGQDCSRIRYNGDYLNGVQLWNALKDAKCKVFVAIHTCHAGSFFKAVNLQSESNEDACDMHADFIADARQFFSKLNLQKASNSLLAAANVSEPKLLIWTSNKAEEYGWMVNSSTQTDDPTWYKAYGEVGTGLEVSMKKNFDMSKTYAQWWTDSTKSGEASRKNPAYIPGTYEYNKKTYMDGGPTPVKDVYGGFNEKEKIFTL